jgi:hypothetical protein
VFDRGCRDDGLTGRRARCQDVKEFAHVVAGMIARSSRCVSRDLSSILYSILMMG